MGFRCSLLGHTFDETDVRRDREVRGDEVVTVVKTVERCGKCGTERVVSENKEVVSVVDAEDVDLDADEVGAGRPGAPGTGTDAHAGERPADPSADHSTGAPADEPTERPDSSDRPATQADVDPTPAAEDASAADDASDGGAEDESEAAGVSDAGAPDLDEDRDPEDEDVEFITETEGSLPGTDETDVDPSEGAADADAPSGGIGGMAARSGAFGGDGEDGDAGETEDAEILGEEEERERAPGQWPDDPDAGDEPWEPGPLSGGSEGSTEPDEGDERDGEPSGSAGPVEPAPEVEPGDSTGGGTADLLRCPACGHTEDVTSSFTAGDACPECRGDYLEPAGE